MENGFYDTFELTHKNGPVALAVSFKFDNPLHSYLLKERVK